MGDLRAITAGVLAAAVLTAAVAGGEGPSPPPAGEQGGAAAEPADVPAPERDPWGIAGFIKDYVPGDLAADAELALRYESRRRRLTYEGDARERVVVRAGQQVEPVSDKLYRVRRVSLIEPVGAGLARAWLSTESRLAGAWQAGRDSLTSLRGRPTGGLRLSTLARRLGPGGLEPAGSDEQLEDLLAPVPEMPRLPGRALRAGREVRRAVGDCVESWKLAGAGRLGKRKCWLLERSVALAADSHRGALPVNGRAEYLVDAAGSTVLVAVSTWTRMVPGGATVRERLRRLRLVAEEEVAGEEFGAEVARAAAVREMLSAVAARDVLGCRRSAEEARGAGYAGPGLELARLFVAAEEQMAEERGGGRRVELVPEDSFVLISAPEKPEAGGKLVPVVFFHGAAAAPREYFDDWRARAGERPLLLIFPQSRDWTWSARADGAVVGSLLEILGRTYGLDRERLVFAGHGSGAEMAMLMAYGAEFPGYRVRGVVAAGGLLPNDFRTRAYRDKPPKLLERLRSVDAFILGGTHDEKARVADLRNLFRWLETYNPDGIRLDVKTGQGSRYNGEWTPMIIDWIGKLPAAGPAPEPTPAP